MTKQPHKPRLKPAQNQRALGFRSIAPAKTGAEYSLRFTKGNGKTRRKPSMPKMPWEGETK